MDIITAAMIIPGGALLGIIILTFLHYHLRNISVPHINFRHSKFFARKYVYRPLHRYLQSVGIATPLYLIGLLSILAVNVTVLAISEGRVVLIKRSGEAVLINLILILVCGRPNVFSEHVQVSQQFKNFTHRWLSIVAMAECAVHLTAALSSIRPGTHPFASATGIAGLTAAISMAVLGVSSLPFVRRHAYELFLNIHISLTVIIIAAIFLHLDPFDFSQPSIILLIIAGSLCALLIATRIGISLCNRAKVIIFEENGLLKAKITLARPRKVCGGQYIFLRVPSTSALSINESHPFFIASWDQDEKKKDKARNVTALIQRREGFTRLLRAQPMAAQPTAVRAFVEGPYGESLSAEDYGNVILFASGIGVAAHLGCIKQLLNARGQGPTRTQVISLLWEVDEIKPWDAAITMVHELLNQDADRCDREGPNWIEARSRFVFQYTMFVRYHPRAEESRISRSGRQRWNFKAMDAEQELTNLKLQGRRTLISVCANRGMTDVIRSAYLKTLEVEEEEAGREEVVLHTYDFHPEEFRVPEGLRVPEELRVPTVDPPGGLRPKSLRSESAVVQ
ncbi:ferric-chelate reductase Frp1 [Pseudogymnoascus australis]